MFFKAFFAVYIALFAVKRVLMADINQELEDACRAYHEISAEVKLLFDRRRRLNRFHVD